jgi:hypothetical protein
MPLLPGGWHHANVDVEHSDSVAAGNITAYNYFGYPRDNRRIRARQIDMSAEK